MVLFGQSLIYSFDDFNLSQFTQTDEEGDCDNNNKKYIQRCVADGGGAPHQIIY